MKINNILYTLCLIFAFISFSSCDDDDDKAPQFDKNVLVNTDNIEMDPNSTTEVHITGGNGAYTLKSTNEEIATASLQDTTITIKSNKSGDASIIITDAKGVNGLIKVLVYKTLAVESSSIDMSVNSIQRVKITSGNGSYTASPSDDSLNSTIVTEDDGTYIEIKSSDKELTDAEITISDRTGHSVNIKVNVIDKYAFIKKDDTERIEFKGQKKIVGTENIKFYNGVAYTSFYQLGWIENNDSRKKLELVIPLTQNLKTIGVKNNAQITFNFSNYDSSSLTSWTKTDKTPATQVLKYDAATGKVWIVFYITHNNVQHEGIICMKIE